MINDLLSGREMQALLALGRGLQRKEIALELRIAEGTVSALLSRVYLKLGVRDRAAALRRGRRMGLL